MNILTNTKEEITFDIEGAFAKAMVEDNKVTSVTIRLKANSDGNVLCCADEKFLRDTYKAIGDLLRHVDNKRNVGHQSIVQA